MSPIAACIISPNFEFFKLLMEREQIKDPDSIKIEDLSLIRRQCSFAHFICKKHRITEGNDEDLKKIFSYLKSIGYTIKSKDDKASIFRQLIRSWALNPTQAKTSSIWKDFYGLVK
jgi:hypothetical protein